MSDSFKAAILATATLVAVAAFMVGAFVLPAEWVAVGFGILGVLAAWYFLYCGWRLWP